MDKQPQLTAEQWNAIFDCVTYRTFDLEDAKEKHPHATEFIQGKIKALEDILEIIGPYSV